MNRQDMAFGAAVVGAVLLVAGVADYPAGWVFVVGGAAVALAAVASAGTRGSLLLGLLGGWLLVSPLIGWAAQQWNLFLAGIAAVTLGILVGAAGSKEEAFGEGAGSGG